MLPQEARSGTGTASFFDKWITRTQLAEALSVSPSFISKMMLEGLPCKRFGRATRFQVDAVVAWFERRG
jgi:phage terminase Nu1 subunit (DNA packaging protein)